MAGVKLVPFLASTAVLILGLSLCGCGSRPAEGERLPAVADAVFAAAQPKLRGIPTQSIDEAASSLDKTVKKVVKTLRASDSEIKSSWPAVRAQSDEDDAARLAAEICASDIDDAFSEQPADVVTSFTTVVKNIDDSPALSARYLGMRDDAKKMAGHVRDAAVGDFTGLTTALAVESFQTAYCP